jgi:hypothetical protein
MKYARGIDAIIADCTSLHVAIQGLTVSNKEKV